MIKNGVKSNTSFVGELRKSFVQGSVHWQREHSSFSCKRWSILWLCMQLLLFFIGMAPLPSFGFPSRSDVVSLCLGGKLQSIFSCSSTQTEVREGAQSTPALQTAQSVLQEQKKRQHLGFNNEVGSNHTNYNNRIQTTQQMREC